MDKRIQYSRLIGLMERKTSDGTNKSFDFIYVKKDGSIEEYKNARMTSYHAEGDTVNILIQGEIAPKKFKRICILKFNDIIVFL